MEDVRAFGNRYGNLSSKEILLSLYAFVDIGRYSKYYIIDALIWYSHGCNNK